MFHHYHYWNWRIKSILARHKFVQSSPICAIRKNPFVHIVGTRSVVISWETSCSFADSEFIWFSKPTPPNPDISQCYKNSGSNTQSRFRINRGGVIVKGSQEIGDPSIIAEHRLGEHAIFKTQIDSTHYLHQVLLDNLPSDSIYHYHINLGVPIGYDFTTNESGQVSGAFQMPGEFTIVTNSLGLVQPPIQIALVGDSQNGAEIFFQIIRQINRRNPHAFGHLGDMVQFGYEQVEWDQYFFDPLVNHSPLCSSSICFTTQGNHDQFARGPHKYWNFTGLVSMLAKNPSEKPTNLNSELLSDKRHTYNAFSLGSTRWIILDSNDQSEEQIRWLEAELSSFTTQKMPFRFVCIHIPPFIEFWDPKAWIERNEKNLWTGWIRTRMVPLFEKYRVDVVFSGHQHNYQRGYRNGVYYVISGGGGGRLDKVRVENLNMYKVTAFEYHYLWIEQSRDEIVITANGLTSSRPLDVLRIPRQSVRKLKPSEL